MYIPLEDEVGDVIGKARRGLDLSVEELAARSQVDVEIIRALEGYRADAKKGQIERLAPTLELDTEKLWEVATEAWAPERVPGKLSGGEDVVCVWHEPDRVWSYVLGDAEQCVVIDAGAPAEQILSEMGGRTLLAILLTHTDVDHVAALVDMQIAETPVYVHEIERSKIETMVSAGQGFKDGELIKAGPFSFMALHTPGHSPGETCFQIGDGVFTGDALFAASIGGTAMGPDLYPRHKQSVRDKVLSLPLNSKLFPGHGPQTTVANELDHNPFF